MHPTPIRAADLARFDACARSTPRQSRPLAEYMAAVVGVAWPDRRVEDLTRSQRNKLLTILRRIEAERRDRMHARTMADLARIFRGAAAPIPAEALDRFEATARGLAAEGCPMDDLFGAACVRALGREPSSLSPGQRAKLLARVRQGRRECADARVRSIIGAALERLPLRPAAAPPLSPPPDGFCAA